MAARIRPLARWVLAAFLLFAGLSHLFWARETFQAQVPDWLPLDADLVVVASGVVEIALGAALILARGHLPLVGALVATFFVAVFPGNVAQYVEGNAAFGLDTDGARLTRLFFQPLLVAWALWCTGAWRSGRRWLSGRRRQDPRGRRSSG